MKRDVFRAYLQFEKCWLNLCLNNEALRNYNFGKDYVQEIYEAHIPKDRPSLYFSHGTACRDDPVLLNWQEEFKARTGIGLVDPFNDKEEQKIKDLEKNPNAPKKRIEEVNYDIVMRDIAKIALTDGTLVYINGGDSVGTHMEMPYAFKLGKPVYSVVEKIPMRMHPWIWAHSTEMFKTFNAFEKYILNDPLFMR